MSSRRIKIFFDFFFFTPEVLSPVNTQKTLNDINILRFPLMSYPTFPNTDTDTNAALTKAPLL